MNLYTMAEAANNYSSAGAGKTKLPTLKMLLLGILAGFLIGVPSLVTNMATYTVVGNSTVRMISGILFALPERMASAVWWAHGFRYASS